MAKVLAGQLRTVPGVYYAVAQKSRVISTTRRLIAAGANPILVTEPIANDFRLLKVQVWAVFVSYTGIPTIVFEFHSGTLPEGADVVVTDWDKLLVLKLGDTTGLWSVSPEMTSYEWTMRKAYTGKGRRFAVSTLMVGIGDAHFYASFQIEEG